MQPSPEMIRKAAVLVSSLDDDTADKLLDQMPPEAADLVRRAAAMLDNIDPAEAEAVIGEFFGRVPQASPAAESSVEEHEGVELSAKLAREFGLPDSAEGAGPGAVSSVPAIANSDQASPFNFLKQASIARIAPLLAGESPQAIALVAAHLPPEHALEVLSALPAEFQAEVLRRMASLGDTDPEIVLEVERSLQSRMSQRSEQEQRQSTRLAALSAVLRLAPDDARRAMLNNLSRHEPRLAEDLGYQPPVLAEPGDLSVNLQPLVGFADLDELDDQQLFAALEAADPELTTLALAGASPQLVDRVVRRFPAAEGRRFRRALDRIGPTRLRDIERAQQELLALAVNLASANRDFPRLDVRGLVQAA